MRVHRFKCSMICLIMSPALAFLLPTPAQAANPLALTDVNAEYLLGTHLEMLRDPSGELTINDVVSSDLSRGFTSVSENKPNLGYTADTVWYRFSIENRTGESEWILDAGREWIEEVSLYTRAGGTGTFIKLTTGAKLPILARPVFSEHPALPIVLNSGTARIYYLSVKSEYMPLTLLLGLATRDRFEVDSAKEKLFFGAYYGVLVVMAAYNLVLAVSLRKALFAKLSAILVFLVISDSGVHGHLSYLLPAGIPMIAHHVTIIATSLTGISVAIFTMDMLQVRRYMPMHHKLFIGWIACSLAIMLAGAITLRVHETVFGLSGIGAMLTISAGIRRFFDRDRAAVYFTIALLSWMVPVAFVMGAVLGLMPLFLLTEHGVHIGGVIMSVLLSFGVAEQVNRVNRASRLFLPKPFLSRLGHESIADVKLGDSTEAEMTVLFSDIRNFTTRSEHMSPSETFSFLNTYLSHMVPAIEKHGGLIDKYIGDAIMALFPDSADHALDAAIAMQATVERLNDARPPGQETISIGIGLHRGRLMLGTVGDRNRLDVTVISDAVNVASRLESLTKEKGEAIIASGDVVKTLQAPDRFSLKPLGTTSIKGRVSAVEIWAVGTGGGWEIV